MIIDKQMILAKRWHSINAFKWVYNPNYYNNYKPCLILKLLGLYINHLIYGDGYKLPFINIGYFPFFYKSYTKAKSKFQILDKNYYNG